MDATGKYRTPKVEQEGDILPNKLGLTVKADIEKEEAKGFIEASLILTEELTSETVFDTSYIYRMHKLALGHLYDFAGKLRTVNMSKGGFAFPAAFHLSQSMDDFQREILDHLHVSYEDDATLIEDIARVHGELVFIHPFREGNGRTARLLANIMAFKAGRGRLHFEKLDSEEMFARYVLAVQKVGLKEYEPMREIIGYAF